MFEFQKCPIHSLDSNPNFQMYESDTESVLSSIVVNTLPIMPTKHI